MDADGPTSDSSFGSLETSSPTPPVIYYYFPPASSEDNDDVPIFPSCAEVSTAPEIIVLRKESSNLPLNSHIADNTDNNTVTKSFSLKSSTLVFFDLETTGLPRYNGALNTQITEISFIAVGRKSFESCKYHDLSDIRIISKLSLCIKPRCSISYQAAKITGLNNFQLEPHHFFDETTAQLINNFLIHLPQPVCLLAHNGNELDFPLLKAEFRRVSVSLPPNILTADTLIAIRMFDIFGLDGETKKSKYHRTYRSNSLENLFRYFFKKKHINKHSSEGDCVALMMVCHKLKEKLLPWIDQNQIVLENIFPLW